MKIYRLLQFALTLTALGVFRSASADKGVFNTKITPDEFLTHTATTVTISAEFGTQNIPVSSIAAYQTTQDGQAITKLGLLVGNGTRSDATVADAPYTLKLNVNTASPGTIYVKVVADYKNDPHHYYSQVLPITAYNPIPAGEIPQFEADLKAIKQSFLRRLVNTPIATARILAYLDAKQHPDIHEVHLSEVYLSIVFKHGVRGSLRLDEYELPRGDISQSGSDYYKNPGNGQLLIFAPGYDDASPQNQIADLAQRLFSQTRLLAHSSAPITITKNARASLEAIKYWGDYRAVILHTHGGLWGLDNASQQVTLLSGTSSTEPLTGQNSIDLTAGRIGIKGVGRFIIFPAFISKHAVAMRDTFFYLGACYSFANDSLWQALRDKGAKLAFGWSNTVARGFNEDKFRELIKAMLSAGSANTELTAKQAYDAIFDKVDGWCPINSACLGGDGARLTLKTATPAWGNFTFSSESTITDGALKSVVERPSYRAAQLNPHLVTYQTILMQH
jgi:hypothetical protein